MPLKKGRRKKVKSQNSSSAFSTTVELFEKVVNNDPTTQLMSINVNLCQGGKSTSS